VFINEIWDEEDLIQQISYGTWLDEYQDQIL